MTSPNLSSSRRNNPYLRSWKNTGAKLVSQLLAEYQAHRRATGGRGVKDTDKAEVSRHLDNLLMDLSVVTGHNGIEWIGYSRNEAAFRKHTYRDGYTGKQLLSKTHYLNLIDFFEEAEYIEHHKMPPGKQGISSRIKPTKKLGKLLIEHNLMWPAVEVSDHFQTVIIKKCASEDPEQPPIFYSDDGFPDAARIRKNLKTINQHLSQRCILLQAADKQIDEVIKRLSSENRGFHLDYANRTLRRVFNNGTLDAGGRFYGGWWQGVPREYRKFISIDGRTTVELDYGSHHPRLLYAKAGYQTDDSFDAYSLPDWPKKHRALYKQAFNQIINSKSAMKDEKRWKQLEPPDPDTDLPLPFGPD